VAVFRYHKTFVADMATFDDEMNYINNIPHTIDVFSIHSIVNDTKILTF